MTAELGRAGQAVSDKAEGVSCGCTQRRRLQSPGLRTLQAETLRVTLGRDVGQTSLLTALERSPEGSAALGAQGAAASADGSWVLWGHLLPAAVAQLGQGHSPFCA